MPKLGFYAGSLFVGAIISTSFAASRDNFNLGAWKLQLPVGSAGRVNEVRGSQLAAGYTDPYFYFASDGAMVFWAPVNGVTTENTHYPRSELRQTEPEDWPLSSTHLMTATCRVTQLPANGGVVIGQIHGSKLGGQVCKLYWKNGSVEYHYKDDADREYAIKLGTFRFGETIHYQIGCAQRIITVTVNGRSGSHSYAAAEWQRDRYYFKAGAYCQDNQGTSKEGARVEFTALTTSP